MSELTEKNFGIVVAYILPGFVALWGMKYYSPTIEAWITTSQQNSQSVASFCYVTLASLAAGMTISAVRWAILDTLHHATGITPPAWKFANLDNRLQGFLVLVESHYRYYQHFGNTLIAAAFSYLAYLFAVGYEDFSHYRLTVGFLLLEIILFAGSRDCLKKYYSRTQELLNYSEPSQRNQIMTNGVGLHDHDNETTKKVIKKKKVLSEKKKPAKPDKSTAR
jgi:hypothetical protein